MLRLQQSPADWPTYRGNNARTAATPVEIPDSVSLLWKFTPGVRVRGHGAGGRRRPGICWVARTASCEPWTRKPASLRWKAYTGGAVLYPPSVADGRALVGSGDGYAYAFEAATGRLLWRFRAAPADAGFASTTALLSTWPVATGVVVDGQTAYCAAGINNYDGTHVYALDAASGASSGKTAARRGWERSWARVWPSKATCCWTMGSCTLPVEASCRRPRSTWPPGSFSAAGQRAHRGRELQLVSTKDDRGETQRRVVALGQPLYSTPESPVFDRNTRLDVGRRRGDSEKRTPALPR